MISKTNATGSLLHSNRTLSGHSDYLLHLQRFPELPTTMNTSAVAARRPTRIIRSKKMGLERRVAHKEDCGAMWKKLKIDAHDMVALGLVGGGSK